MAHKIGHTRKKPNGKTEKWTGKRWVEQTQPLKNVGNLINKTKLFIKNKSNPYKSTGTGNQHLNFNKPEGKKDHNKKFASFREDSADQAKLNKQVKEGKKVTYKRVHSKTDKANLSDQHKVKSKSSNTGKKMGRIERENRKRFGDAHVDKLKAKHKAWKEARRNKKKLKT
tara:strand:- start:1058 stop:1567 length:510 start_codon:yes stop_codon:yes gene_type:complete